MSNNNSTVTSGGVGLFGLLGVLFIGLKLTDNIDWSWWLVLLPFYWIVPTILFFALGMFVVSSIAELFRR